MVRARTIGEACVAWGRALAACLLVAAAVGCGAGSAGTAAAAGPGEPVKLSAFGLTAYGALGLDGENVWHAVYSEQPDYNKPCYLYHRMSKDGGQTWSESENISDEETDHSASTARLVLDKQGRFYVVWKETGKGGELLEGPGGGAAGRVRFRVRENGRWSKPRLLGEPGVPVFSFSVVTDADGAVHVVWSQPSREAAVARPNDGRYAGWVRAATLDGSAAPAVRDVVFPTPFLSAQEVTDLQAKGVNPAYELTVPRQEGLINLSARVASGGVTQFLAEREGYTEKESQKLHGRQIVFWDGKAMTQLYEFHPAETHNTYRNPPYLWERPDGKLSMIRAPEKGATPTVREYPLEGNALGEPATIAAAPAGGSVSNWQAHRLPSGALAVTVALSTSSFPDKADLFLVAGGPAGWTAPVRLTDNASKEKFAATGSDPAGRIGALNRFSPRHASVAADARGKLSMVTVSMNSSIFSVTGTADRVAVRTTGRVDSPDAFFVRLSPEK